MIPFCAVADQRGKTQMKGIPNQFGRLIQICVPCVHPRQASVKLKRAASYRAQQLNSTLRTFGNSRLRIDASRVQR
jgi:hypothetical protein